MITLIQTSGSQPGVRVPLGVSEKLTEGMPNFENHSKQVNLGRIFDLVVTPRGYNFDLGVRRGGKILLRGYTSTKRLRTPDPDHT